MKKIGKLELTRVKVKDLKQHPLNPNQGDVGAIVESLEAHGYFRPVLVQASTMHIIAGNHTVQACQIEGLNEIDVILHDVDDDQALRIMLADNETANKAQNDPAILTDLLESLVRTEYGLAGTGFTGDDLDELIAEFKPEPIAEVKEPGEIEPPLDPVTKPGDVWLLGPHRLICGDSTNASSYETLMGSERADCIWTDPPYGVEYVGGTKDALTIKNDGAEGLPALLNKSFACWQDVSIPGAAVYVAHPAGVLSLTFLQAFVDAGWRLHQTLCWDKQRIALGHSDYHYSHEPILFGYLPGGGRRGRGGQGWYGDNAQKSVISIPKPSANKVHPTMKPVELIVVCVKNSSPTNGIILDPFGGSGSTLIAAHHTGRKARLIELDPAYCDVICNRFQGVTGIVPILESTGEEVSFVD
jgi:DNA modification methylase